MRTIGRIANEHRKNKNKKHHKKKPKDGKNENKKDENNNGNKKENKNGNKEENKNGDKEENKNGNKEENKNGNKEENKNGNKEENKNRKTKDKKAKHMDDNDADRTGAGKEYNEIKVAAWNISGAAGKYEAISAIMDEREIDFLFLSETWASARSRAPNERVLVHSPYVTPVWRGTEDSWSGKAKKAQRAIYGVSLLVGRRFVNQKREIEIVRIVDGLAIQWRWNENLFNGVYLPPQWKDEDCMKIVGEEREGEKKKKMLLIGDFNLRSIRWEDRTNNERANGQLMEELDNRGLCRIAPIEEKATFSRITYHKEGTRGHFKIQESKVDHILGNDRAKACCGNSWTYDVEHELSDHAMISCSMRTRRWHIKKDTTTRWRLRLLKDDETRKVYAESMRIQSEHFFTTLKEIDHEEGATGGQTRIDKIEKLFRETINTTADIVIGKYKKTTHKGRIEDSRIREIRQRRKEAYKAIMKSPEEATQEQKDLLDMLKKAEEKAIKRERERSFREFDRKLEGMNSSETMKVIRHMKNNRNRQRVKHLGSDEASIEEYRKYFEGQFQRRDFQTDMVVEDETTRTAEMGKVPFNMATIAEAIKTSASGKAPGETGLITELIKPARMIAAAMLYELFERIWKTGICPSKWRTALIHPIPKKGDLRLISNYRPISLTETTRKIYERCILWTALRQIAEPLDIAQGGFREKRSTIDQIASLNEAIIVKRNRLGRGPILAFLDIKAAYDTVDRRILWNKIAKRGASLELLNTLKGLFEGCESKVVVEGKKSGPLGHQVGILQGSIISPVLYAIFIDDLAEEMRKKATDDMGGTRIASFMYADDIAIIADDIRMLQAQLDVCQAHSIGHGYRFAPNKCEVVMEARTEAAVGDRRAELYGQEMGLSKHFSYLGIAMTEKGVDWERQVERQRDKFTTSVNMFRAMGFNLDGFSYGSRRKILTAFLRPMLEYGMAIMPVKKKLIDKVEKAWNMGLRSMFSMDKTTSRALLLHAASVPKMEDRLMELQTRYANRVYNARRGSMVKEAYEHYANNPSEESVFRGFEKNKIIKEQRKRLWQLGCSSKTNLAKTMQEVIEQQREEEALALRDNATVQRTFGTNKCAREVFGKIDRFGKRSKRTLTKWLLQKTIGKPVQCMLCRKSRISIGHIQTCAKQDVDEAFRRGDLRETKERIRKALQACRGDRKTEVESESENEEAEGPNKRPRYEPP